MTFNNNLLDSIDCASSNSKSLHVRRCEERILCAESIKRENCYSETQQYNNYAMNVEGKWGKVMEELNLLPDAQVGF